MQKLRNWILVGQAGHDETTADNPGVVLRLPQAFLSVMLWEGVPARAICAAPKPAGVHEIKIALVVAGEESLDSPIHALNRDVDFHCDPKRVRLGANDAEPVQEPRSAIARMPAGSIPERWPGPDLLVFKSARREGDVSPIAVCELFFQKAQQLQLSLFDLFLFMSGF